jgi:hypothetical protein
LRDFVQDRRVNAAIEIPEIAATDRLVELPALELKNAVTGRAAGLSTRLRLATRSGFLLARFDCRHQGIIATLREDNAALWTEDAVEAFIAFDWPAKRYTELEVNPLGARFSARVSSPKRGREGMTVETFEWTEFSADVRVRERHWSALLRIPLAPIGGGEIPRALFANFFRIDRSSGEFQALFPTLADPPDFHRPGSFGRFEVISRRS